MKITVKDDKLHISIPLMHIKCGLENHPMSPIEITDLKKMGLIYKKYLLNETCNDGNTTLLEDLLDRIGELAIENAEEGFKIPEDPEEPGNCYLD